MEELSSSLAQMLTVLGCPFGSSEGGGAPRMLVKDGSPLVVGSGRRAEREAEVPSGGVPFKGCGGEDVAHCGDHRGNVVAADREGDHAALAHLEGETGGSVDKQERAEQASGVAS